MAEESENAINLLDYPPQIYELQHWKGTGQLRWRNDTCEGEFVLSRLLNGRLRFIFKPSDWREQTSFFRLRNLVFEGVAEDGSSISVSGIHFTRRYLDEIPEVGVGYAQSASRVATVDADKEVNTVSIQCDLTNYTLNQRNEIVKFQLDGFDINIRRLRWGKGSNGLEEHEIAYHHASVTSCLQIENISTEQTERAIDCLQEIAALLSIACRGQVAIVARHIWNQENGKLESFFDEPPFTDRRWGRPLIPSNHIEEFLVAAYPASKTREQKLELAYIADHYLQALTLRSAWPQSVGIFTAMETLKTAFFNQYQKKENLPFMYWVIPPKKYQSQRVMIEEVIEVLTKHFPRFGELNSYEKDDLQTKIKTELNRRPYKTQLERMLDVLGVSYSQEELEAFIRTRNHLIHQGTPVPASAPLEDHNKKTTAAWRNVKNAAALFERALLAFLNYHGPSELLDEGWLKQAN